MFSVIIPLYNKATFIEKCLLSVANQTFSEYELIIVNDGSTDNSMDIVSKLVHEIDSKLTNDQSVQIVDQIHSGASVARNRGAAQAKYDYLAFLDADDWWHPHFLGLMMSLILLYPDAAVLGSNYFNVKNGTCTVENKGIPNDFSHGYIDYLTVFASHFIVPFNCSFVVVKKSAYLSAGGFNPSLKFGEDFDLWLKLAQQFKIAYINRPIAYSNQDVPFDNRLLGKEKKWKPTEHFAFNLGHFDHTAHQNRALKYLIDGVRLRSLQHYRINGWYRDETTETIKNIDFSKQPLKWKLMYYSPRWMALCISQFLRVTIHIRKIIVRLNH